MATPNETTSSGGPSSSAEVLSLRLLVNGLITAVLVGSIGINTLLFKQLRILRAANTAAAPRFDSAVKRFNEVESVEMKNLINELVVFSKTNPDFAEILKKYEIRQNTGETPTK